MALQSLDFKASFYTEQEGGTTPAPGWMKGYATTADLDRYGDIVAPGAFMASIADRGLDGPRSVKMLWQHNPEKPIGKWTKVLQDEKGLLVEGQINLETTVGAEAYKHIKAGEVASLSVGFRTKRREFNEDTGVRTILEGDLWEISPVTFPANESATIDAVKGAPFKIEDGDTISALARKFADSYQLPRRQADAALDALKAMMREDPELKALKAAFGIKPEPAQPENPPPNLDAFAAKLASLRTLVAGQA